MKKLKSILKNFNLSDFVSNCVASWSFVVIYTGSMLLWVVLHKLGFLSIDNDQFMIFNLFLSWFAGTQASIVLKSSNRQSEKDRNSIQKGIELDKQNIELDLQNLRNLKVIVTKVSKLETLIEKVTKLEEFITLMEKEEEQQHKK